jgi:hypothetical protein
VNVGVAVVLTVTVKALVVPNGLVPLQSNSTNPEVPAITEETFGVRLVQLLVIVGVVAVIAGKLWVKSVEAAYATPIVETNNSAIGAKYLLEIFNVETQLL